MNCQNCQNCIFYDVFFKKCEVGNSPSDDCESFEEVLSMEDLDELMED